MPDDKSVSKNDTTSIASEDKAEKVSFTEAFKISKWAISLIYKNYPTYTIFYIITTILDQFQRIIYTFIFAKILDVLVETLKQQDASIQKVYPYIGIMVGYSIIQFTLSYISNWAQNSIHMRSGTFLGKELYCKLHSLGIQSLELPEVNNRVHRANDYLYRVMGYFDQSVSFLAGIVNLISIMIIVGTFLPIFTVVMILISIPYFFIDKTFRKKIFRFIFDNTEKSRIAGWVAGELNSPRQLQEISVTNAFKWFDKKSMDFKNWIDNTRLKMRLDFNKASHLFGVFRDIVSIYGYIIVFKKFLAGLLSIGNISFWMSIIGQLGATIATNRIQES